MSFEDDAYWESEYTDRSTARYAVSRRPAPPVDELAVRRKRRQDRHRRPPRQNGTVQKGFDTERPSWLDDPGFIPTDVSRPDTGGHDSAVLDVNRPELGTAFDEPGRRWTDGDVPRAEVDWDDDIDEPYDHRAGMDRRSTVPGPASPAPATAAAPAGILPVQRAPADSVPPPSDPHESTSDGPSRPDAGADRLPRWFVTKAGPAETTGPEPDTGHDGGHAPAPVLAPADLRAIRWRLDGATLREVADDGDALRELGVRLDGPLAEEADHVARAGLLSLRAEVYRLLGELGMAAAASRLALAHAESARDVDATVIAQAELAHVLRLRGHYAEADRLLEEAASSEAPELLRSVVHEYAGRSCFDQGRHMEALNHFARAIRLGAPDDLDLVERIDVCLEAVYIHVLRDGWGPYPRRRRDILR